MQRTRRGITNEFRQEAVNLPLSSGWTLKQVTEEAGITANTLPMKYSEFVSQFPRNFSASNTASQPK
ncbi:MAG: transposase [Chthoniobacteraceae bacterium]